MINVVGLGYIGLPTALMLAAHGVEVIGTDYNLEVVKMLNCGKTTFMEEGLELLFKQAIKAGIKFSTHYQKTDIYIVSVPTPYDKLSKKLDPQFVISAIKSVIEVCQQGAILVIESTIAPGTVDRYIRPVIEERKLVIGEDIHLVHAPERIIPGNMIQELVNNARTIGADNIEVGERVKQIYQSFCSADIVITDIRTAEMTKVVENTYRDINIAFANELTKICQMAEMDVYEVIKIANKHPRVNILSPGPGVGGHCISVDPWFLVGDYPGLANLILAARKINDSMPEYVLERVSSIMRENNIKDVSRVGLYGLTYKEDVDDLRESPSLQMLESMERHLAGERIKIYDPFVNKHIFANQCHELEQFLSEIDMVIIMVGHTEIRQQMGKLKDKIVFDTKNIITGVNKLYKL